MNQSVLPLALIALPLVLAALTLPSESAGAVRRGGGPSLPTAFSAQGFRSLQPMPPIEHPQDSAGSFAAISARFGAAIAIDGDIAVIGSPHMDGAAGANQGAAYVYRGHPGHWEHLATLTPSDAEAHTLFGNSVAISGSTILVGSIWDTIDDRARAGSVYVFTGSNDNWTQVQKISAPGTLDNVFFGASLALQGDTTVIGAFAAALSSVRTGAVYAYQRNGGTFIDAGVIAPPINQDTQYFGYALAMNADRMVIGAPMLDSFNPADDDGGAFLYQRQGMSWTLRQSLNSPSDAGDRYGTTVAIDSDHVVVAAPYSAGPFDQDAGRVNIYHLDESSAQFMQTLVSSDPGSYFGQGMAVDGASLWIGQPSLNGTQRLYRYQLGLGSFVWSLAQTLLPPSMGWDGNFGQTIAFSPRGLLVGAPDALSPFTPNQPGRVHAYRRMTRITTVSSPGGQVLPSGQIEMPAGEPFSMHAIPAPGYRVIDFRGCGGVRNSNQLMIALLRDDCTVNAEFFNTAPTIGAISASDTSVDQGGTTTLSITASDDNDAAALLTYAFDCNGDGSFETGPRSSNSTECSMQNAGTFTLSGRVNDRAGAFATANVTIEVADLSPRITTFNTPGSVDEDVPYGVSFDGETPVDGRQIARYEVDCDYFAPDFDIQHVSASAGGVICLGQVTGGPHIAAVRAVDNTGAVSNVSSASVQINPINDAPTLTISGNIDEGVGAFGGRSRAGFITGISFGPPDEASQTVLQYVVTEIDDANDIVSNLSADATGSLNYTMTGAPGLALIQISVIDSGGTPGQPVSAAVEFQISNEYGTDLRLSMDDGISGAAPGDTIVYSIVVTNAGPNRAMLAALINPVPTGLIQASWFCTAIANSSCDQHPFGTGGIDVRPIMQPGAVLEFAFTATVEAQAGAFIINTASITPPDGMGDSAPVDNVATDTNAVLTEGIFSDGFENVSATMMEVLR